MMDAHSIKYFLLMSIENIISKSIKDNNNPIGFDVFMDLALYHQEFGYYRSNKTIFGHRGDFITSPEVSDLFGFSLAKQCKQILNGGNILEFGAGSGILATQILFKLGRMESLPKKYFIIELSSQLRQTQKETIKKVLPEVFDRIEWLTKLPKNFKGLVIANEVLDAFPVKRITFSKGSFYELGVGFKGGDFNWERMQEPLTHLNIPDSIDFQEGYTTEINIQSGAWIKSLYDLMIDGTVILIDYGMTEAEYFHPQRNQGTLKCFSNHKSSDNPFTHIGKQDITASVNFSNIASIAMESGFNVSGYTTQSMFLISLGIDNYLKNQENEEKKVKIAQEIKQLVLPGTMGEVFKVMALSKKQSVKLKGFKELNLSNRL